MIRLFRQTIDYSRLETVESLIFFVFAIAAVVLVGFLMNRRLAEYRKDGQRLLILLGLACAASCIPVMLIPYAGSSWTPQYSNPVQDMILQAIFTSWHHRYLTGMLGAALMLAAFSSLAGFKTSRILDTFALYLPLGLALIQCAFLITGEGWGRAMSLSSLGLRRMLHNPTPLYDMAMNLALFYFLKRIHILAHSGPVTWNKYRGSVFGLFFLLYGAGILILQNYGRDLRVLFNLTLTQWMMFAFILGGAGVLAWVFSRKGPDVTDESQENNQIRRLLYLAGFVVLTFILIFAVYYLIKYLRVISWPFRTTKSVFEAYERILEYLPMMALPAIAFFWMKKSRMDIRDAFRWKRATLLFYPVFAASAAYGMYKLFGRTPLKGWAYLPPAVILCTMNALSEEFSYRFVFFRLLRQADYSRLVCHTAQAVLYALPHFILAGFVFGSMSFMYGLLMGFLADNNDSITPAVICHFIIDIGLIGNPLMRS